MGGVLRDHVQCALDYFGHLLIRNRAQTAGAKFVCETFDLVLHKTPPPFTHCLLMDTEACSNFLAGPDPQEAAAPPRAAPPYSQPGLTSYHLLKPVQTMIKLLFPVIREDVYSP